MIKSISKYSVIAAIALVAAPSYAQSIPIELDIELSKKFSHRTLAASEFNKEDGKVSTDYLGPYIYKNYITRLGAGKLGGAEKRIRKYCEEEQDGSFIQTAKILPEYQLSEDPITITDDDKTFSVTANDIYFLTGALNSPNGKDGSFARNNTEGWPGEHTFYYEKLSEKGKLGVFKCEAAGGSVLWSMAIIPNHHYTAEQGMSGNTLYKKQIAALPLDAETLENYKGAMASLGERTAFREQEAATQAAEAKSAAESFRATADVGSESHCGMIIQKRASIFEVDLKATPARESGKSTAWIKRENLYPEGSGEICRIN